jgi:putative sterol carrier protein
MPAIYTTEWYESLKRLLNENPQVAKNAPTGTFRVLAKIFGDEHSHYLPSGDVRNFVVLFADGKCLEYQQVETPPPRKDFEFIFELPASVFEKVAAGQIDLIDAGLKGRIKITGDMRILIRHAEWVNVLSNLYAREVETVWPKGKPDSAELTPVSAQPAR